MTRLNYHHLMYFRSIALEGGISNAAKKLLIGQPALSAQLKTLEDSFGHALFERKNRSLFLTDAGRVALQYANDIHLKGQELLAVIEDQTFSSRVHLNLGALDSVPKTLITKLINNARQIMPCKVTVLEGRGEELLREVMSHELDILISNYPAPTSGKGGLYSRSLAKIPIAIFGAPKFKYLKNKFPKSLAGQPMILPTNHSKLRQDIDHFFSIKSVAHSTIAEIHDTAVQKLLALEGVGLVPLPEFIVKELVSTKKLIKLGMLDGVFEEFWMISAKRTIENPVASKLVKGFNFSF